ncbi:hypothetical protein LRR81_12720 [Metabacillus sp. GX 13764]|uniref:hypothetical protein n=1 Tax=Metabacillus kandeliae TaxID=2900151 RepID=UPI001E52FB72|nr:hypothetical protein [Metabacillus kandeliae]MCD7035103.1 hypothetical protein [Metabacillus kandeliae]
MKKDVALSIVLHLFLGCLFISFVLTAIRLGLSFAEKSVILIAGIYPALKISDRITASKSPYSSHPVKIAETVSLFIIPFAYLIMIWT